MHVIMLFANSPTVAASALVIGISVPIGVIILTVPCVIGIIICVITIVVKKKGMSPLHL